MSKRAKGPPRMISASELCRQADITRTTLSRYVRRKVVQPLMVLHNGQELFAPSDVAVARAECERNLAKVGRPRTEGDAA